MGGARVYGYAVHEHWIQRNEAQRALLLSSDVVFGSFVKSSIWRYDGF
ncbi:hypothetical protein RB213_009715 [Colletotrichum asianum]